MSKTYVLIDFMNLAYRAKNVATGDIDMQIGTSMHIILNSIRSMFTKFKGDHLLVCCEGRSWIHDVYPVYKKNRIIKQLKKTEYEREDDAIFLAAMEEFEKYLTVHTNASILKCPVAEADHMIAVFISCHPDDNHIIISSDTDFDQLLATNVRRYNGMEEQLITLDGIFDKHGNAVIDSKTKTPKKVADPEYILFEKCIRGDSTDNVMSAYPGITVKSSKKRVGIVAAFNDRHVKGYDWNNFMQSTWVDVNGETKTVGVQYQINKRIIDLSQIPDDIRAKCEESLAMSLAREPVPSLNVGSYFLKFCEQWNLVNIGKYPNDFTTILNKRYIL